MHALVRTRLVVELEGEVENAANCQPQGRMVYNLPVISHVLGH
jgi:hypothetical protein